MLAPFIMTDELIYSELGRSFAASGSFAIRDVPTSGYGVLYPVLIAPAYALFDSLTDAYAAVKVINSLAMSLAAVPDIPHRPPRRPAGARPARGVARGRAPVARLHGDRDDRESLLPAGARRRVGDARSPSIDRRGATPCSCSSLSGSRSRPARRRSRSRPGSSSPRSRSRSSRAAGSPRIRASWRLYALFGGAALIVLAAQVVRGQSLQRAARRLRRRRRPVVRRRHRPALLALARGGADAVPRRRSGRRHARAARAGAEAPGPAAGASRGHGLVLVLDDARRRRVRVRVRRPDPGAQHVRDRAALPRRTRRLGLDRGAAAVAVGGRRHGSRRRARRRLPLHALHRRARQVGHARDPPDLVGVRAPPVRLDLVQRAARRARCSRLSSCSSRRAGRCSCRSRCSSGSGSSAPPSGQGLAGSSRRVRERSSRGSAARRATGSTRALPEGATTGIVWTGLTDRFTVNQNEFFNRAVGPVYYIGGPTPGNLPETAITRRPEGRDPATRRRVAA